MVDKRHHFSDENVKLSVKQLIAVFGECKGFISIYNIVGKLIEKTELSGNNQIFDLSAQPNGIYIMQIRIEDKISSWKIIKE